MRGELKGNRSFLAKLVFTVLVLYSSYSYSADIVFNFCPVTKIQASQQWNAVLQIQNNSGVVLDPLNNKFVFNWPSLAALQYPFSNTTNTGNTWSFNLNLNWPGTMAVGATTNLTINGNSYSGVLQFPTTGTFTQNGVTYTVEVKHCNQTQNYEMFDTNVNFNRDCFLYSPPKICLGQGATEIWKGEGVFDAMIPVDRPSWAIGVMVAHRLFTNMAGNELISPNFWMATAMNESRMTCDPTISPNVTGGHLPINGNPITGTGVYNPTNNCFQVLNIGYTQISDNQPELFAQTNAYCTAQYSNVVDNGNWETGAIALAYYHYQNLRYWDQIYCFNVTKTWKDAADPYAVEKIFYHGYHDGPNAGIALLNDIKANYAAATAAANMNTVITTAGTWSQINSGGSSQKVGNFTFLLDGNNGTLYPYSKTDTTTKYLGCYNDAVKWTDVVYYLDRIKILYPHLQQASVQNAIKSVFNSINAGANVNFSDLGKVIDEIVIQMGGHDPSKHIAIQFAASKVCNENALGISLRTNDTLCPGEDGQLQVWLSGDKNFKFTIKFPDGSVHTFSNVDHSPFIVPINQPGPYEVVHFEDSSRVGDLNCLFSKITVQSDNGNIVRWDKSNLSGNPPCTMGPLVINNTGPGAVAVSYTYNGGTPQTVNIPAGTTSYTVSSVPLPGQYIITTMNPNVCGTPINDTITICSDCIVPKAVISGDAIICEGDSAQLNVAFSGGLGPYTIKLSNGISSWKVFNIPGPNYAFYASQAGTYVVDSVWNAACDTLGTASAVVTVKPLPGVNVSGNTSICPGDSTQIALSLSGTAPYSITVSGNSLAFSASGGINTYNFFIGQPGTYLVEVKDSNACVNEKQLTLVAATVPLIDLGNPVFLCFGETRVLDAGQGFTSYLWSGAGNGINPTIIADTSGTYSVVVTNADGCKATDSVTVSTNPEIKLSFPSDSIRICPGDSLLLTASLSGGSPAYAYAWGGLANGTAPSYTASANGWHTLTASDAKNCMAKDSIYVSVSNKLSINLSDKTLCTGDSVLLNCGYDAVNYSIQWSGGQTTQSIYAATAGTYSVLVTNNGNCSGSDSMNLSLLPLPDLSGVDTSVTTCSGIPVTLSTNMGSGYNYNWNPGGISSPNLVTSVAGTYELSVTNASTGCASKTEVLVLVYPKPLLALNSDIDTCEGNGVQLQNTMVQNGLTYNWTGLSTGSVSLGTMPTLIVTTSDTYYLEVSDSNSCKNSDTVKVIFRVQPQVNLLGGKDTLVICRGQMEQLDAGNNGMTYVWLPGGQSTQSITVSTQGLYSVIVSNGACSDTDAVYVQSVVLPQNVLSDGLYAIETEYCFAELNESIVLSAMAADQLTYTYLWQPGGQTTQFLVINAPGTYSLTISLGSCSEKETISIVDYCETTLYIPNAFTPNNDNNNEKFGPKGMYVNDYRFSIFNRWGELIFESVDLTDGWDGKYKGYPVQEGVFIWKLEYSENLRSGRFRSMQKTGTVTLIR